MNTTHCVISGANRGLGLSLVAQALEKGWAVSAISHREDCPELRALADHGALTDHGADKAGGTLRIYIASLDDERSMASFAQAFAKEGRAVDLLINNAAVLGDIEKRVGDGLDYADALRTFNVNVLGPLRLTEAVWPLLLKTKQPCVANISSEAGSIERCGRDGWYAYNTSKAALNMAGRILHNQLKEHGGRVIQIHPGWVKTWIKGHFDSEASLTADESARAVWERIDSYRALPAAPEMPPFVDWEGKDWPW